MKKLIDIFVNDEHDNPVLISAIAFPESATWDDITVTKAIDERLRLCFSEKPISPAFQSMDKLDILQAMGDFLSGKEYELNGLYESTQFEYDPIANYDMTETSRDEDRATTSGNSTESSTKDSELRNCKQYKHTLAAAIRKHRRNEQSAVNRGTTRSINF